MIFLSIVDWLE